ncbi:MAG TPA: hypothetical protein VGL86_03395 [Polyangia bacterium]
MTKPKAVSMAALARLADDAPDTPAAAQALDWLGDLRRGNRDWRGAEAAYARAYRSADPEGHRLAARGLGDLSAGRGDFTRSEALYREARVGAAGVLALELDQKIKNAHKARWRAVAQWASWAFVLATLAFFLARSRFWAAPWPGWPTEASYVAPMYALLILGCVGRDPGVLHALWLCALWSIALIAAAGLAARRRPPVGGARVAHVALLLAANGALFYAVMVRARILDQFFYTVVP